MHSGLMHGRVQLHAHRPLELSLELKGRAEWQMGLSQEECTEHQLRVNQELRSGKAALLVLDSEKVPGKPRSAASNQLASLGVVLPRARIKEGPNPSRFAGGNMQ